MKHLEEYKTQLSLILSRAERILKGSGLSERGLNSHSFIAGLTSLEPSPSEDTIMEIACARLGLRSVDLAPFYASGLSDEEYIDTIRNLSSNFDILLTHLIDRQSFGNGHRLTEGIIQACDTPVLSTGDELYATQAALGELVGISQELDGIQGKTLTLSWGFGSRFDTPGVAHSFLLAALTLGANVTLVEPPDFQLGRTAVKRAKRLATDMETSFVTHDSFDEDAFSGSDAVFALNWCRLDDYQRPERNSDFALQYKDWFFDEKVLKENCYFATVLPVQAELLVAKSVLDVFSKSSTDWFQRRIAVLVASTQLLLSGKIESRSLV